MAGAPASRLVVHAALAGKLLVALTKFAATWWTGSSAMLSEAIHSTVDTADQVVLLYGLSRAERPPDALHTLGYGRELYFWSFIVALLMFTLGAGVTGYEGIAHIRDPHPIENAFVAYLVLAAAFVFEGTSWYFALREFKCAKGDIGYFEAMRRSKDPPTFIVLFEDSAALVGLLIAFVGTFLAQRFGMPVLDGVATLGIALVLSATALVLAVESKGLLIGEPASPDLRRAIVRTASGIGGIARAQIVFTVHMAPDQVVAARSLEFRDTMTAPDIEAAIDALEDAIQVRHPEDIAVFCKPEDKVDQVVLPGRFPGRARRLSGRTAGSATPSGLQA